MDWKAFMERYNARANAMQADKNVGMLGLIKQDGDAALLRIKTPDVYVVYFAKDKAEGALVSARLTGGRGSLKIRSKRGADSLLP